MNRRTKPWKDESARRNVSIKEKATVIALGLVFCIAFIEVGLRVLGASILFAQERINRRALDQAGAYRIMCLGESTTADLGNETIAYPRQLAQILTDRGRGRRFSVINKGIIAANTSIILSKLEANLDRYRPDMVIAMMGLNDTGNARAFDETREKKPFRLDDAFKTLKLARLLSKDLENKKTVDYMLNGGAYFDSWHGTNPPPLASDELAVSSLMADARRQELSGRYAAAEEKYKELLKMRPNDMLLYPSMVECCRKQGKYREAEEIFRKAMDKMAENRDAEKSLAYERSFQLFARALHEGNSDLVSPRVKDISDLAEARLLDELGQCYIERGKYSDAERVYGKILAVNPDMANTGLAKNAAAQGRHRLAREYERKAQESRARSYDTLMVTWKNYRTLMKVLDSRGIKLVVVQYPLRSVVPLKQMLGGKKDVILVDNEPVFRKAMQHGGYDKYFTDRCYVDYGHATTEGNRLLAENIAHVLFAEVFNK